MLINNKVCYVVMLYSSYLAKSRLGLDMDGGPEGVLGKLDRHVFPSSLLTKAKQYHTRALPI